MKNIEFSSRLRMIICKNKKMTSEKKILCRAPYLLPSGGYYKGKRRTSPRWRFFQDTANEAYIFGRKPLPRPLRYVDKLLEYAKTAKCPVEPAAGDSPATKLSAVHDGGKTRSAGDDSTQDTKRPRPNEGCRYCGNNWHSETECEWDILRRSRSILAHPNSVAASDGPWRTCEASAAYREAWTKADKQHRKCICLDAHRIYDEKTGKWTDRRDSDVVAAKAAAKALLNKPAHSESSSSKDPPAEGATHPQYCLSLIHI